MKLQTDLKTIRRLARIRLGENLDFRAYLRELPFPMRRIDQEVRKSLTAVAGSIDCTQCANCCRVKQPVLGPADTRRLARALKMTPAQVTTRFLMPAPAGIKGMIFKKRPCPFLKDSSCSVYACRPADCRSYPHLHRREFARRTHQAILNYGDCPIVFNVLEILKTKLARRIRPQRN